MKKLQFKSNGKEWLLVDDKNLDIVSEQALVDEFGDYISLSSITEDQASEVSSDIFFKTHLNKSSIESLNSLLKSKGVDESWDNPILFKVI